jgi:hypothetical protein
VIAELQICRRLVGIRGAFALAVGPCDEAVGEVELEAHLEDELFVEAPLLTGRPLVDNKERHGARPGRQPRRLRRLELAVDAYAASVGDLHPLVERLRVERHPARTRRLRHAAPDVPPLALRPLLACLADVVGVRHRRLDGVAARGQEYRQADRGRVHRFLLRLGLLGLLGVVVLIAAAGEILVRRWVLRLAIRLGSEEAREVPARRREAQHLLLRAPLIRRVERADEIRVESGDDGGTGVRSGGHGASTIARRECSNKGEAVRG